MANISQVPGELNIKVTHGDDFEFYLDFNIDLTGYTFTSNVTTFSSPTLVPLTVTPVDVSQGQLKLTLSKESLDTLASSTSQHRWYFDWDSGTKQRRVLAGTLIVEDYP